MAVTFNRTSNGTLRPDFQHFRVQDIDVIFGVLYAIIVLLGVVGNCFVIAVVKRTPSMHTTTNFLIVNLACADIVALLWNPRTFAFTFYPIHPLGITGDWVCKIFTGNAVISVAIGASVLTLTVLSIERYHALVKPMQRRFRIQMETLGYAIAGIWILALLINLPDFFAVVYDHHYGRCVCPYSLELVASNRIHVLCTVTFVGVVPFLVLGFCYFQIIKGIFFDKTIMAQSHGIEDERSKWKIAKLLISVSAAFYICYMPYGIFISFLALSNRDTLVQKQHYFIILLKIVEFLVTLSSCLNPFFYAFQSSNYREGFRKICCVNTISPSKKISIAKFYRRKKTTNDVTDLKEITPRDDDNKDTRSMYGSCLKNEKVSGQEKSVRISSVGIELEENPRAKFRASNDGFDGKFKRPSIIAWTPQTQTKFLTLEN